MSRILVHAPTLKRRRPMRARRAVAQHVPAEYSTKQQPPLWLVVGTGIFGAAVLVELAVGLVVIS